MKKILIFSKKWVPGDAWMPIWLKAWSPRLSLGYIVHVLVTNLVNLIFLDSVYIMDPL